MLDTALTTQLQAHLQRLTVPVELQASLDDSPAAVQLRALLKQIADLSTLISLQCDGNETRRPSFAIRRAGTPARLRFAGIPVGHEFSSLVLALLWAGGHPPKVAPDLLEQVRTLGGEHRFEVFMSLSCHNCPDVVQALSLMALVNPGTETLVIDGALFQAEVQARGVMAVPTVIRNGELFGTGRMGLEDILRKLGNAPAAGQAQTIASQTPFDILVIGGGPAGVAAAVYAARKGVRTCLIAERLGGQTNDTLGIENFPSVLHTEGPRFAASLEEQAKAAGVQLISSERVIGLSPGHEPGAIATIELASGPSLRSRTVILATGARWRTLGVPGEERYRNRGVAFCPHCDGPLFKGKRTAVIGGGNSGVEAAIDLAGLSSHVTLIEYAETLKADAMLVAALRRLPNVTVLTGAQTLDIHGDEQRVTGLRYRDRSSGHERTVAVEGVFVQIGLVPNTEFLAGEVALTPNGEIRIDERGRTSQPGLFAAGDATTVPYKQIVVAAGDGAKAALAAFEYLMRLPQPASYPDAQTDLQALPDGAVTV